MAAVIRTIQTVDGSTKQTTTVCRADTPGEAVGMWHAMQQIQSGMVSPEALGHVLEQAKADQ